MGSSRVPVEFAGHPSPFIGGTYRGIIRHVVDGDTFDLLLDVGLNEYRYLTTRLWGVNAPELKTKEGKALRLRFAEELLGAFVVAETVKDGDKYGRYLAKLEVHDPYAPPYDLAERMIAQGMATRYEP